MIRATMVAGLDDILRSAGHNLDVNRLLDEIGSRAKPPQDLRLNAYLLLLERIAELMRDPCFGLAFAKAFPVGAMKVFSYLVANAPELRTMVSCISRYAGLQIDALQVSFEEADEVGTITWRFGPQVTSPTKTMLEFCMSLFVDRLRMNSGSDWTPRAARFAYPDPRSTEACRRSYAEMFGADLDFDVAVSSMTAPSAAFERPLKSADRKLFELMLEYADREMSAKMQVTSSAETVASVLIDSLPLQQVNLESVAATMKRTPRQLQEDLRKEGTNFEAVLVEVRRRLAESYLKTSTRSMTEIAMMLGFSEQSAFTRAVKSWYGIPPTELRSRLRSDANSR